MGPGPNWANLPNGSQLGQMGQMGPRPKCANGRFIHVYILVLIHPGKTNINIEL